MKTNDITRLDDRRIVAERLLDALREPAFKDRTDLAHLAKGFGPAGAWRFVMHRPGGRDYGNVIPFLEIDPPSRLVYAPGGENETAAGWEAGR